MRITNVESVPILIELPAGTKAPISVPHADQTASTIFKGYRSCLVRVHTDEGLTGVGECMVRLTPQATAAIVTETGEVLRGLDPLDTSVAWELMFALMMNRGHLKGFFMEAVSGIDIALWDLKGKILGKPVYQLLGGAQRDKIWAYASSLRFRGIETTVAEAKEFVGRGYNAMKLKLGSNPHRFEADLELATAVREAVGSGVFLSADANCGLERTAAMQLGRGLERLNFAWFEEPLAPDDLDGYAEMARALDIPIAGGETEFTRFGFREIFKRNALDIVQPNVTRSGGFTECMRIAAMAEAFHVPYAPHTGSGSAVCMAAELHLAAALPNFLIYEHMQSDWSKTFHNPLRIDLVERSAEAFKDGFMALPRGPGLGIQLNDEVVERHRIDRQPAMAV
ncbi:MAG: mandelate racemase/muconate lactonizing enzyme family protein [Vulcanimicrobiaceae bacterium]